LLYLQVLPKVIPLVIISIFSGRLNKLADDKTCTTDFPLHRTETLFGVEQANEH